MSKRRLAARIIVCSVFLLLIAMTVHSMYIESEAEAETEERYESTSLRVTYSDSEPRLARYDREPESVATLDLRAVSADAPDSGIDEVFMRELTLCIASDCMRSRRSGDAGVAYASLPPPPPKVR